MTGPITVAGVGAVTGYGWTGADLWQGVGSGTSAGRVHDLDGRPCLAALVPDEPEPVTERLRSTSKDPRTRLERAAFAAVGEAVQDAEARGWVRDGARGGVIHCTGIGDIGAIRDNYFRSEARPLPSLFAHLLPTSPASLLAKTYGCHGPNLVLNAACASVNVAALTARDWFDADRVDHVIVSCADFSVIDEIVRGFELLKVLVADGDPFDVCRPFQEGSRGFFLGEAAAAFVLTRSPVAEPRATVLGGASTHDAHDITKVEAGGEQLRACFDLALADAGVPAGEVAYVNAHGTGTRLNDGVEGVVVDELFPPATALYSTKPLTGHCMAASAGVELAIAVLSYEHGTVPGTPRMAPGTDRLVTAPETRRPGPTVCSAIGLGGYNSALVIDEPRGGA